MPGWKVQRYNLYYKMKRFIGQTNTHRHKIFFNNKKYARKWKPRRLCVIYKLKRL